jgi:hypothetical protein
MVAWYGSFNVYLNCTCCTRPSFGGKVTTGVLCLAAGTVVAGIVVAGIVVAGLVVARTVVPDELNLTTYALLSPVDVRFAVPAPGSKSAVPKKDPVTYVLPEASTATPLP